MLTEKEYAELNKVCPRTVRRLIESGRLAASSFGSGKRPMYRIDPAAKPTAAPAEPAPAPRGRRRRVTTSPGDTSWRPKATTPLSL